MSVTTSSYMAAPLNFEDDMGEREDEMVDCETDMR